MPEQRFELFGADWDLQRNWTLLLAQFGIHSLSKASGTPLRCRNAITEMAWSALTRLGAWHLPLSKFGSCARRIKLFDGSLMTASSQTQPLLTGSYGSFFAAHHYRVNWSGRMPCKCAVTKAMASQLMWGLRKTRDTQS
jgi:hypothetical protein